MSQNPLPPVQNTLVPNQATDQDKIRQYSGWYPRWWLLSAIFCALLIGTLKLVEYWTCAPPTALLCQIDSWTDWRQEVVIGIIWLIFLLGWRLAFILGVKPIEIAKQRSPIAGFFREISQFEAIYFLLLTYGIIAFICIIAICISNHFNPTIFAFASIVVFVANCSFFYKISLEERHSFIIAYAVLALICVGVMFLSGRFQLTGSGSYPILMIALILIGSGLWSRVRGFLWRNQTRSNPTIATATPEARLAQSIQNAPTTRLSPGSIQDAPTTRLSPDNISHVPTVRISPDAPTVRISPDASTVRLSPNTIPNTPITQKNIKKQLDNP